MAEKRPTIGKGTETLQEKMRKKIPNFASADVTVYRDFIQKHATILNVPERTKCTRKAVQLRLEGNRFYLEKNWDEALEKYNESICFAETGSEQLGIGFANRSAVYVELDEYEFALANIALAKKHHFPEKLMPKVLAREQSCREKIDAGHSKRMEPFPKLDINVTVNPKIPFVADRVAMKVYPEFGRGLVAERDFRAGDIILDEKPSLVINEMSYRYNSCNYCSATSSYHLFPCPGCVSTMYCREECLEKDKRYWHRFECGIADKLRNAAFCSAIAGPKLFFYGLTLFGDDLQAMMDFCRSDSAQGVGNPFELDFREENLLEEFKVLHRAGVHHITVIDSYRRIGAAINYVVFMQHSSLKHLVKTAAQRDFVLQCFLDYTRKTGALLLDATITSTVSHFGSICNHSCDPNAAFAIQGGKIRLAILRPVRKDEQICVSYGPTWWRPKPNYQSTYTCRCVVCVGRKWHVKRFTLPESALRQGRLIQATILKPEISHVARLDMVQKYVNRYAPYHPDVQYGEGLHVFHHLLSTLMSLALRNLERDKVAASLE